MVFLFKKLKLKSSLWKSIFTFSFDHFINWYILSKVFVAVSYATCLEEQTRRKTKQAPNLINEENKYFSSTNGTLANMYHVPK